MPKTPQRAPSQIARRANNRRDRDYLDGQAGWRVFFFSVAIACIAGLGFRLYFTPDRIRHWVEDALSRQSLKVSIHFDSAELSLARGSLPQLAVVLRHLEVAPAPLCHPEPSVKMGSLRIPVRITSLFSSHIAVGVVSAADIFVDLDGLKVRCSETARQAPTPLEAARSPASEEISDTPAFAKAPAKPWWGPEQLRAVQNLVSGFDFSEVEVVFENKIKKIYLESFLATSDPGEKAIHLKTAVRIPEEMTFGEKLPPLKISGEVEADAAQMVVKAVLSEGSLESHATLKPAPEGQIEVEARAAVKSVPLSTTVPLLTKAGIIKNSFRPRFLWLGCQVSVHGLFQGLLKKNPLKLEQCEVQGEGARIYLDSAIRGPDGSWEPFAVELSNVSVARMLETFGASGPDGVVAEYGRLNGRIHVRAQNDAEFQGAISDMELLFSNRNIRTLQKITSLETKIKLQGERIIGAIDQVGLAGGDFKGRIDFDVSHSPTRGEVTARIESLRLGDAVQKLMFTGTVANISGEGGASIRDGHPSDVRGSFTLHDLESPGYKVHESSLQIGVASSAAHALSGLNIFLKSPEVLVSTSSPLGEAISPLLMHRDSATGTDDQNAAQTGNWIRASDIQIHGVIPEEGGLHWEHARAGLEKGRVRLASSGAFDRDSDISAWLTAESAVGLLKTHRWAVSGSLAKPILSEENAKTRQKNQVGQDAFSMAKKTSLEIRDIGEKVIRKARGFIPRGADKNGPANSADSSNEAQ